MEREEAAESGTGAATGSDARTGFGELGLSPKLVSALAELGYEEPTPIHSIWGSGQGA